MESTLPPVSAEEALLAQKPCEGRMPDGTACQALAELFTKDHKSQPVKPYYHCTKCGKKKVTSE